MTFDSRNISIVGAPFNGGQPKSGVEKGPATLRDAGLNSALTKAGWKIAYDRDCMVPPTSPDDSHPGARRPRYVGAVCENLFNMVQARSTAGDFVLTIGGDHSVAAGSIAGILSLRPDTFVVWVDAHADINSPTTSESGNIHGMPVALLAHLCGKLPGFDYLFKLPPFDLQNIAYIGLRDVDKGEKALMAEKNVTAFYMEDVEKMGIEKVMEKILQLAGTRPLHLSFDVDGIDPKYMPATGTPVHAGLTLDDSLYICKTLAATRRVTSFDLVEINPDLGGPAEAKLTGENSLKLVEGLLCNLPSVPAS